MEEAHRGTLFLDEIGELLLETQPVLLRYLESGEVRRLGEVRTRHSGARLVSATNRPLEADVGAGRFRQDLYYRLNVLTCVIPPLRDRPEDIDAFVQEWLRRPRQTGTSVVVTAEGLRRLQQDHWPGNLRELQNVLERAALASPDGSVGALEVEQAVGIRSPVETPAVADSDMDEPTRLLRALEQHHWHLGRTAQSLDMDRTTLWRKMRRFKLTR